MSIFIDVSILPQTFSGLIQVITLGGVYGYGLFYAANLISDGAELLLLVPAIAGMVGSIVLPVLGAVPDGMMVLFSAIGENAQEEVSVGVGALCGSTIMLLTVPWCMSIVAGRVTIDGDGQCVYKGKNKLPEYGVLEYKNWKQSGIKLSAELKKGAHIMALTMSSYALIQIPALFHLGAPIEEQAIKLRPWALLACFSSTCFLAFYLYYSYKVTVDPPMSGESGGEADLGTYRAVLREDFIIKAIAAGKISLVGVMQAELEFNKSSGGGGSDEAQKRLRRVIEPFFAKYDNDNSGYLDMQELGRVFADMGENVPNKAVLEIFRQFDTNGDGNISSDEFFLGVSKYIQDHSYLLKKGGSNPLLQHHNQEQGFQRLDVESSSSGSGSSSAAPRAVVAEEEEEEQEEEDEMPEDLVNLPADEQQRRIQLRAAFLTIVGTAIVLLLSDPMVAVLSEVGKRTGVSPFYISFIFAPIASNASEVVASYAFAAKKTSGSIAVSISQLQGAAVLNNTFVLGIFCFVVWRQGLMFDFLAEILSVVFVQFALCFFALKPTNTLRDGFLILALYPASLFIVAFLEALGVP